MFTWEGQQWAFQVLPQGPCTAHNMSWTVAWDLSLPSLPHAGTVSPLYWWHMLTCDLPLLQDTLQTLWEHLPGRKWERNPQKTQGPGTAVRFGEPFGQIRRVLFQKLNGKRQAYPTHKDVKEVQASVGIWELGGVLSQPGTVPLS